MTAICAGGFSTCPNHVLCYLSSSCARTHTRTVAIPSLLPRPGWVQAGGQAPLEHPTVESGSSAQASCSRGLSAIPWGRAGQRLTSQNPVPPYLREMQGRPGNGSGDQLRVPVAGAEGGPKPSQTVTGSLSVTTSAAVQRWPATVTVTRQGQASASGSGSRAAGACPGTGMAEAALPSCLRPLLKVASRRGTALSRRSLSLGTKPLPWQGRGAHQQGPSTPR